VNECKALLTGDEAVAAAIKATVSNLKLLGKATTQTLIGPRGYKQEEEKEEEEDEEEDDEGGEGGGGGGGGGGSLASQEATAPRWRGLFKLSKCAAAPALDATQPTHGGARPPPIARHVIGRHSTQQTRTQNACRRRGGQYLLAPRHVECRLTRETRTQHACG
jgi:hypothetical protein